MTAPAPARPGRAAWRPRRKDGRFLGVDMGEVRYRVCKGGEIRAYVKMGHGRWRPRAEVAWEAVHGPLPPGRLLHHLNGDPLDDRPVNLLAVTRAEHARIHAAKLTEARRAALKRAREQRSAGTGASEQCEPGGAVASSEG